MRKNLKTESDNVNFDLIAQKLIEELKKHRSGKSIELTDLNEVTNHLQKSMIETLLGSEMEDLLGYPKNGNNPNKSNPNYRNGVTPKVVNSSKGEIILDIPRDRQGEFEPKVVKKHQRDIFEIEEKVITLYARGLSTRDISDSIEEIYGLTLSAEQVSHLTDKCIEHAKEWQRRPLQAIYPIVFLDGLCLKLRIDGVIKKVTAYAIIGIDLSGQKECLGFYIGSSESSRYWLNVLNELKARGVKDILICCTDGLKGFPEAIEVAFPSTEVQQCIVHQIRTSTRMVSWKDQKAVVSDLKKIYKASSENTALIGLQEFKEKWDDKYSYISKSWEDNWPELSTFFKFGSEVRRLIYTTNPIESFNRTLRKYTKTKTVYPTEDSIVKNFYLVIKVIEKKWRNQTRDWWQIFNELNLIYGERIKEYYPSGIDLN